MLITICVELSMPDFSSDRIVPLSGISKEITNPDATKIALLFGVLELGGESAEEIRLEIRIASDEGKEEIHHSSFWGKTTNPFKRNLEFDLPKPATKWAIAVRRLDAISQHHLYWLDCKELLQV